jgi:hypothetical protein
MLFLLPPSKRKKGLALKRKRVPEYKMMLGLFLNSGLGGG